jgi:oxygen-independent coproporphyrinogen-3 oxidase
MTPPGPQLGVLPQLGVYIHWPYCARICPYCDFNVYRNRADTQTGALVDAIITDLAAHADHLARQQAVRPVQAIFLGGGTPSLLPPEAIRRIIAVIADRFGLGPGAEVSLEANPEDVSVPVFESFVQAGVNRFSLGLQALNDSALSFLKRNHDAASGRRALAVLTGLGAKVSADLIYALPGQTPEAWLGELDAVVAAGVGHISAYQLTIEPGTAFARAVEKRRWSPMDTDLQADLFDLTFAHLSAHGFSAYETSNYAREQTQRSVHNRLYWRAQDWIGVGPGAHGRLTEARARLATLSTRTPGAYLARVAENGLGWQTADALNALESAEEAVLMGLRLSEGLDLVDLARRFGWHPDPDRLAALVSDGLIEAKPDRLVLTGAGRPLADRAGMRLLS